MLRGLADLQLLLQNYNTDLHLTSKNKIEIKAYKQLFADKLGSALDYLWWYDQENYNKLTYQWYTKRIPFLMRFFMLSPKVQEVGETLRCKYDDDIMSRRLKDVIISEAKDCLNLLSDKLGSNDYFFGDNPSSLDAVVFSYLAPLLKITFPSTSALQNHINGTYNLNAFVNRILGKYFPSAKDCKYHHGRRRVFLLNGLLSVLFKMK